MLYFPLLLLNLEPADAQKIQRGVQHGYVGVSIRLPNLFGLGLGLFHRES